MPFMAVLYVLLALIILLTHIPAIPGAIALIVKSAFSGSALAGGVMGTMVIAMQKGIARGIFSNEAGLGSAPIAAAAAQTKEPARQGLVSMTGTFIDTIVICTMTGLSIVIAGTWNTGLEGVEITTAAFPAGTAVSAGCGILCPDAVPCIFCFHYDTGVELLWRTLPGIFVQQKYEGSENLQVAVYPCDLYRTLYDGGGCLEYCRYF